MGKCHKSGSHWVFAGIPDSQGRRTLQGHHPSLPST
ncbi:MAG: KxYKxGKxW signal peptide domain-containing protein [Oscillospiraceae bacterium]|nr:KxYKxGKxW signal peptide domain-containing protein [Acidaminococcaceae bacterium]MBQ9250233.1 KxYKxGKxW signal peptide domain-containing protein [Oscillospiraceae bacterium]